VRGSALKTTVSAGALVRRDMRALLDQLGITWTEHKGLLDSVFVIECTEEQFRILARAVEIHNG
jgi:hypothetical protein